VGLGLASEFCFRFLNLLGPRGPLALGLGALRRSLLVRLSEFGFSTGEIVRMLRRLFAEDPLAGLEF